MTQYAFDIEGTDTGDDLVLALDSFRDSIWSRHKGSVAPTYRVAGMEWLDDAVTNKWVGKIYDGSTWAIQFYYDVVNDLIWVPTVPELLRFPLAGGTANALTLTPMFTMTAYVDTDVVTFEAASNNSGAATLNISALGTKAIRKIVAGADVALVTGDLLDGIRYTVSYDSAANAAAGAWILASSLPSSITDDMSGLISVAANKSYTIRLKAAIGGTISETTTKCLSGACTMTFKINTTALGGTANSVTSSEQSQAHSTANIFVAGDDIVVTVSANASCLDAAFSLKYTRAIA